MSITSRLKRFYKVWLEPPGVYEWRTRLSQPELQKFWTGTPVQAPPVETKYFDSLGLKCRTITRRDDSRSCAYIKGRVALPLPDARPGDAVQFAVTADQWVPESAVRCTFGSQTTRHEALQPGRWLDFRLDADAGASHIELQTDEPLWVSFPRMVRNRVADGAGRRPRHVLVIILDGLSRRLLADRHPTEPERPVTPNLDRFFAGSLDLPMGFASSEWTLPATASFFSGLYPNRHRMVHPTLPMYHSPNRKLLAEYFQEAGFHTLALSSANRLTPAFGSHRGFDRFIYHWPYEGKYTSLSYDPSVWIGEMLGHLDMHRNDSTFTYAHFLDTHPAWNVPPFTRSFNLGRRGNSTGHDLDRLENSPLGREQGRQLLLLRLHEFDRAIGGLLRYIENEIPNDTLVVLTADHGTPWPDAHDAYSSKTPFLNELRIGTSFRMKGPGVPSGRRSELVSPTLDLMPTVLAAAGMAAPEDLDGINLLNPPSARPYLISESFFREIYEIAVSDHRRQWIERYPVDEKTLKIKGPAIYRAGFPLGCMDYTAAVYPSDPDFEAVVGAHISSFGDKARG